ncbi:universal stress protein [Tistrella sp. BH-R2-4]|uniref:Universal stress protein n=1 Tax=Tistrella arctica TaxID=3133430 RepID=A0ABU9YDX3_9PROT
MKTILVPMHGDDGDAVALETAYAVAQHFKSHIEALLIRHDPQILAGDGLVIPSDYLVEMGNRWQSMAERVRKVYDATVARLGIERADIDAAGAALGRPTASWREVSGQEAEVVGHQARLFDLTVVARPDDPARDLWRVTAEAVLFDGGRPVLVTPQAPQSELGRKVLVAWNGSTETAQCVAMAMPWLTTADEVLVLAVRGGMVPGPGAEDLARHLARNGVPAGAKTLDEGERSVAEVIIGEARAMGADLIVKGAYTQSRFRQMIFGGVTNDLLHRSPLPVLFAH